MRLLFAEVDSDVLLRQKINTGFTSSGGGSGVQEGLRLFILLAFMFTASPLHLSRLEHIWIPGRRRRDIEIVVDEKGEGRKYIQVVMESRQRGC